LSGSGAFGVSDDLELLVPGEWGRGPQKFEFTFGYRQYIGPDYRLRLGRDSQGAPVVQKLAHNGRVAAVCLEREVSIGRTLIRRIGKSAYPEYLSRLVGYNPGKSEESGFIAPYAVFTYQQDSLADLSGELPLRPELFWSIAKGLVTALCYAQAAQVVHRNIRMETVRWDGTTVQLADFGHAVPEWELNPPRFGEAPWDPPEQCAGIGPASCRDDSYAVALLLARLATGQDFTDYAQARETIDRLDITQQRLLRAPSQEHRRNRPTAYEMRKPLGLRDPLNPMQWGRRPGESEARARFAALRLRQEAARLAMARQSAARQSAARRVAAGSGLRPPTREAGAGPVGSVTGDGGAGRGHGTTSQVPPVPAPQIRSARTRRVAIGSVLVTCALVLWLVLWFGVGLR
jgi:hypothetical protein